MRVGADRAGETGTGRVAAGARCETGTGRVAAGGWVPATGVEGVAAAAGSLAAAAGAGAGAAGGEVFVAVRSLAAGAEWVIGAL